MKIIVISPSGDFEDETAIVSKLFECGLETFHLRKPRYSTRQLKEYLKKIPTHFHNRIVIHSHHNLARKFNLKGIHLTKTHRRRRLHTWLMLKYLRAKHPQLIISVSHKRIMSLFEDEGDFTYIFLSPVFDSLTGNYQSGFTQHSLHSAIEKTPHKVIARGGVDASILEKAKTIGFDGIALYSCIWKKKNPVEEFNKIINRCTELGIKIE